MSYLLGQFDDPGGRDNDASVDAQGALFLYLLHHEAGDLVVVRRLAPRAAYCYNLLQHYKCTDKYMNSNFVNV